MHGVEQQEAVVDPLDGIRQECGPASGLTVTVVFTNLEGTLPALRTAAELAKSLAGRIVLVAIEVVPPQLPIELPLVPIDFLQESLRVLVSESRIDADEVRIEMCLGRDRQQCLQQILRPRSLVVVGGRKGRWSPEQKLERWLSRHGHQVVFVDVDQDGSPKH